MLSGATKAAVSRRAGAALVQQAMRESKPAGAERAERAEGGGVHFRLSAHEHPLGVEKKVWDNPTQNHVWSEAELEKLLEMERKTAVHVKPAGMLDRLTYWAVRGCYHGFNFVTGFSQKDPSPRSLAYRLLILESIAGCPGMVAAGIRHFRSLRRMERDGGWIHTLLEEAENERMHLLVFMKVFQPGLATRLAVVMLQYTLVAALTAVYVVRPQVVHRFVGYLEETAVQTYLNVIKHLETPGTQINKAWGEMPAPDIAKNYWRLPEDALMLDVVKQICADEMHHRDVNHEFASMSQKAYNPFVTTHLSDMDQAAVARRLREGREEAAGAVKAAAAAGAASAASAVSQQLPKASSA